MCYAKVDGGRQCQFVSEEHTHYHSAAARTKAQVLVNGMVLFARETKASMYATIATTLSRCTHVRYKGVRAPDDKELPERDYLSHGLLESSGYGTGAFVIIQLPAQIEIPHRFMVISRRCGKLLPWKQRRNGICRAVQLVWQNPGFSEYARIVVSHASRSKYDDSIARRALKLRSARSFPSGVVAIIYSA